MLNCPGVNFTVGTAPADASASVTVSWLSSRRSITRYGSGIIASTAGRATFSALFSVNGSPVHVEQLELHALEAHCECHADAFEQLVAEVRMRFAFVAQAPA